MCSDCLKDLLTACFQSDYNKRPEVTSIAQMAWFQTTNWDAVAKGETTPPFDPLELRLKISEKPTYEVVDEVSTSLFHNERPGERDNQGRRRRGFERLVEDEMDLLDEGLTQDGIDERFKHYNFTHPSLDKNMQKVIVFEKEHRLHYCVINSYDFYLLKLKYTSGVDFST